MNFRLLFVVIFVVYFQGVFSQNVPTTVQSKSILLEEFTGIHCGNCPQGHEIARNLMNANENAYSIAIHSGYYAVPLGNEPDFRIPEGEMIDIELDAYNFGYPCGTVNRHPFGGDMIVGRGDWIDCAKTIHAEEAPVNILLTATFDGSNRKLSVKAEGYYPLEVTEPSHWLNIVVIENNIVGPQSGIGGGLNYVHNRMLRAFITPMNEKAWGEEIVAPQKDKYFEFEYMYDLPANINGISIKPEDIELIAFVCAGKNEVLNVTDIKPDYVNCEKPLLATLLNPAREMGARYGFDFFDAQLKNLSHQTINSAKFLVNVNGEEQETEWKGEIPAFQTKPVTITVAPYTINPSNQYLIKLIALNDENVDGNAISGSFSAPIATTSKIFFEIKTDLQAEENRFLIKDRAGNIVAEFGPYQSNLVAIYNETITLDKNETYCFEVTDMWWDGIQNPKGYFKMRNEDEELIVQAFDVKLFGDRIFIHTSKELSITGSHTQSELSVFYNSQKRTIDVLFHSDAVGTANLALYSITGALLLEKTVQVETGNSNHISLAASNYSKGIYMLKIDSGTVNTTQKLIIY